MPQRLDLSQDATRIVRLGRHGEKPAREALGVVSATTFFVLEHLPLAKLTTLATVLTAFLFVVTSLVSAAYVLGVFSSQGDLNPSVKVKLGWGALLGALARLLLLPELLLGGAQLNTRTHTHARS